MSLTQRQIIDKIRSLKWENLSRGLHPGNIGANIRFFREEIIEETQEDFSTRVNITRSSLAHYETNSREIPIDVLKRIADYLDISLDVLVYREKYLERNRIK